MSEPLLRLEDLKTHFFTDDGVVRAVDGVSYDIGARETLAVVGESGSGKSVTALSILRLVAQPPGRIVGGRILFKGRDLATLSAAQMREIRGKEIRDVTLTGTMAEAREITLHFKGGGKLVFTPTNYHTVQVSS